MTATDNNLRETNQGIGISVLVAVYNIEKFLPQCLESLRRQTLKNAEFIVVDDGSTDSSGEICEKFKQLDNRFIVIHQSNRGSYLARKRGVERARGKWTIFVDGDDFLPSDDVLSTELELAETNNVDILRFDVEVVEAPEKKGERANFLHWRGCFYGSIFSPYEIIKAIFDQVTITWNLWDKIYRTAILKQTLPYMREGLIHGSTDILQMFQICFFSSSLCSVKTKPLYSYRLGVGVSTGEETMLKFKHHVKGMNVISCLLNFLKEQNSLDRYENVLIACKQTIEHVTVNKFSLLSTEDSAKGFDLLVQENPIEIVVENLYRIYRSRPVELADRIYNSSVMQCNKRDVRTIAVYYRRIYNGGVEKVISYQIPMFLSLGYKVVLVTEEINEDIEYPIPDGIPRVVLPKKYEQGRASVLSEALRVHGVDVVLYHSASSSLLLFDLIIVKALQRNIIVSLHEITTQFLAFNSANVFLQSRPHVYRLVDALVVLNQMDLNFYRTCGVPACYIPNPTLVSTDSHTREAQSNRTKSVLWIGRLENSQKNYREALDILAGVVREVSDTICFVVGGGEEADNTFVSGYIRRNGLEDKIKFIGFTLDTEKYYSTADVHLITSSFECFPMIILESKAHGLPLVLYEMPYLEILKDKKGYISVPRHDKKAAISKIVELLSNDTKREQLASEAKQSFEEFVKNTPEQSVYWRELISTIGQGIKQVNPIDDDQLRLNFMFWDTTMSFLQEGIGRKNNEIKGLKQEGERLKQGKLVIEKKLKASNSRENALKHSVSFRVGRAITWFPRKVRGGVRCFKQHGTIYTAKRFCWHIINLK